MRQVGRQPASAAASELGQEVHLPAEIRIRENEVAARADSPIIQSTNEGFGLNALAATTSGAPT
jgi:hypothetical protein